MVMIMPPGHAAAASSPWRFSKREKWVVLMVSGLLAALAIVVVISLGSSGHKSGNGCVDVAVAYSTGGSEIYRCGDAAKVLCRSVGVPGGYTGETGRQVAVQCRKAGLPVGA